jgi:hypothetical protein
MEEDVWSILVYFMDIWCMHFVVIWYIFPVLVHILFQEKSGNPGSNHQNLLQQIATHITMKNPASAAGMEIYK